MADIDDIMKDVDSDDVYYEEAVDEGQIKPGTYEASVVALRRKLNTKTKKGYHCDIYWVRYKIANDSPNFSNRLVRDAGQWRYRSPNMKKANLYYKKFLDKLGIGLTKSESDGKIKYSLPSISEEMILGKKVLINVYKEEWSDSRGYHNEPVANLVKLIDDADVVH
jgi:hypothetical protein